MKQKTSTDLRIEYGQLMVSIQEFKSNIKLRLLHLSRMYPDAVIYQIAGIDVKAIGLDREYAQRLSVERTFDYIEAIENHIAGLNKDNVQLNLFKDED